MPSLAFQNWVTVRAASLSEFETAHRELRGTGSSRRHLTQQINQAYAVLLSSEFQGFCRDLYLECAGHVVRGLAPPRLAICRTNLQHGCRLDTGNPNPGNIGADFNRLGLQFWLAVDVEHPRNPHRKAQLQRLNRWRNAIAHSDFAPDMCIAGRPSLHLAAVRTWRKACHGLGRSFDNVMRAHLLTVTGSAPW
jgi:hypothetical protein